MKKNYKIVLEVLLIIMVIIISGVLRLHLFKFESGDFSSFLEKWFNILKENGGIFALKINFGDYNLPYVQILALLTYLPISPLYSIKMVSVIFDYLGAISIGLLIYELTKNKNKAIIGFFITILLPTVILNSSSWAQCDFIYVTFIILALLFLVKDKYIISFIFLGVAFAFKLQTIFILPIFIIYYISERKFPIYYFLVIPIIDFILCLPSILIGKPISEIFMVYLGQAKEYGEFISLNFPGIYNIFFLPRNNWVAMPSKIYKYIGIVFTGLIFLTFAIIIFLKKIHFSKEKIIEFAVWSVMICTFFLPQMHDRYMFAADVLSVIYIIIDKKKWYLPIVVNMASLYTYINYLYGKDIVNIKIVSIVLGVTLIFYTYSIFKELLKENNIIKNQEEYK